MARRTKEEALATRELILDAAERVFTSAGFRARPCRKLPRTRV